jgi:hypothetical protein
VQDKTVVWWLPPAVAAEDAATLNLSFAFITLGAEEHLLPALVLDDWGSEIKSLALYRWIRDYGEQFPRAELFGCGLDGRERQHFLRDLELALPHPCYAFARADSPISEAKGVSDILVVDALESSPRPIAPPAEIEYPLRGAAVRWWSVPSAMQAREFLRSKPMMNEALIHEAE